MKKSLQIGFVFIATLLINYNVFGQNPNWTMPPNKFTPDVQNYSALPTSVDYSGAPATHLHAGYSDPQGNLLFFTVDETVYDKNGIYVDEMRINWDNKKGHSERLILPMGKDCNRFAIIYQASPKSTEGYLSKLDGRRIYMTTYNLDLINTQNPASIGALEYPGASDADNLIDISKRDAMLYGYPANANNPFLYGFEVLGIQQVRANYQIAATELIDNCFYYVFIFEGNYLIRYKLNSSGLEYDNYVYEVPNSTLESDIRSEMEIIKLANGNYRIAIPKQASSSSSDIYSIGIMDIDATTGDVITSSYEEIGLGVLGAELAEPYGLEFDPTGRYLYFTHKATTAMPNALDVYDLNTSSLVSLPSLTGISNYRLSFIERYNDKMYLASGSYLGQLGNISGTSPSFNSTFLSITSGYGSGLGLGTSSPFFRYLLPDQVDMPYANLADLSCDCCKRWHADRDNYTATGTETWSPGAPNNPFGSVDGNVYIRDQLRIKAGAHITINDMKFYFGKDAEVVVERESQTDPPAYLKLTNGSVFTADFTCADAYIVSCEVVNDCDKDRWEGVRVEGYASDHTQSINKQAQFHMEDGSMIEFARTGIRVGHKSLIGYGGGRISIADSYLKDNITGIRFDPYLRISGGTELYFRSFVGRNEFTTTDDWFDPELLPNAFVDVEGASGLYLKGNSYINSNTASGFLIHERGIGVKCVDSRVDIDWSCAGTSFPCPPQDLVRSVFTGLTFGVNGMNSGTATRTITCKYNVLRDNYYGMFLSDFINPIILDNDFYIPPTQDAIGMYISVSTGYAIQNNNFNTNGTETNVTNTGLVIAQSGPADNIVYRNHFTNLSIAGWAVGQNADLVDVDYGLHWICNTFKEPIIKADIFLHGTMSDDQGLCSTVPAGNTFSHSSQLGGIYAGHMGLEATSTSTQDITYNHHTAVAPSPLIPLPGHYNIGHYQLASCGIPYSKNSCATEISGTPEGINHTLGGKSDNDELLNFASIDNQAFEFASQISDLENQLDGGNTAAILELIYNGGSADEIAALLNESGGNISSAVQRAIANGNELSLNQLFTGEVNDVSDIEGELKYVRSLNAKLWNSAISQYMADTTAALSAEELQSLITSYTPDNIQRFAGIFMPEESQEWIDAGNKTHLMTPSTAALPEATTEDGTLPTEIPEWFESDFFASANNAGALNSLYIANGAIYHPHLYGVEWPDFSDAQKSMNGNSHKENATKLVVHPNPFNESVQFDFSAYSVQGDNNRIEFYDLLGKQIYTETIKEDQMNATIQGANLPEGILIYKLYLNNQAIETGKIVRID